MPLAASTPDPANDPLIGQVFGNARIVERLGQGGMGTVYRATHTGLGKAVAIKVLRPDHSQDPHYLDRFVREGQSAAKIDHPNVVQVIDSGQAHGCAYLIMELVQGSNLGAQLDGGHQFTPRELIAVGRQVIKGLLAIHELGIIHRDIKPDNILLSSTGQTKIADMGLARELDDANLNRLTATGMVVGTPLYLAPEAIRDSRETGPEADIYSLGATFYHMLAGRPPFTGNSPYEVMRAHLEERFQPLREINPQVPPGLARLIERCLDKDPHKRPGLRDLQRLITNGSKVQGNQRGLSFIAAAVLTCICAGAILAWHLLSNDDEAPNLDAANTTQLQLSRELPKQQINLDRHGWQAYDPPGPRISPGSHHLALRAYLDGTFLYWESHFTVSETAGDTMVLEPQPEPIRLDQAVFLDIPAELRGDVFQVVRNGTLLGSAERISFEQAGHYHLAVWNAHGCVETAVTVRRNGSLSHSDWQPREIPSPDALLKRSCNGAIADPHHLVSWWWLERFRHNFRLAEPRGWSLQREHPLQPAVGVSRTLIIAFRDWLEVYDYRLPTLEEAIDFNRFYQGDFWYQSSDGPRVSGTGAHHHAFILIVPLTSGR